MPVTSPEELMVATVVLLLLQVPPLSASLSVVVRPVHNAAAPVIGDTGFTVSIFVEKQPPVIM